MMTLGTSYVYDNSNSPYKKGGTASVFIGELRDVQAIAANNGVPTVAVKEMNSKAVSWFYFEVAVMAGLKDAPNVVRLLGCKCGSA